MSNSLELKKAFATRAALDLRSTVAEFDAADAALIAAAVSAGHLPVATEAYVEDEDFGEFNRFVIFTGEGWLAVESDGSVDADLK